MKYVVLALLAVVMLNCATIPRAEEFHPDQIHVQVQNLSWDRVTVYLMSSPDGGGRQRLLACNGLSTCNYWIPESRSRNVLDAGTITLGWRVDSVQGNDANRLPGQWVNNSLTMNVSASRSVVILHVTTLYTSMYPGESAKQAD